MEKEQQIPIWFFIGGILTVYGVLILGSGIYAFSHPPEGIVLSELHADTWWGLLLLAVGLTYLVKFCPYCGRAATAPPPPGTTKSQSR